MIRLVPSLLVFIVLASCSGIRNDYPEKKIFRLETLAAQGQTQDAQTGCTLLVKRFNIAPEFQTTTFVYRKGPSLFAWDFYNNFMVPPATMITDLLAETLWASAFFRPVLPETQGDLDFQVWGKLIDLYADIQDPARPNSVMTLRLVLDQNQGGRFIPLLQKTYRAEVRLAALDPQRHVQGLNQCLNQILEAFFKDLGTLEKALACPAP